MNCLNKKNYFYILSILFISNISCNRNIPEKEDKLTKIDIPTYDGIAKINLPDKEGEEAIINRKFAAILQVMTALEPGGKKSIFFKGDVADDLKAIEKRRKKADTYFDKKNSLEADKTENIKFKLLKEFDGLDETIAKKWSNGGKPQQGIKEDANESMLRSKLGTTAAQIRQLTEVFEGKKGISSFNDLKVQCNIEENKDIRLSEMLINILYSLGEKKSIVIFEEKDDKREIKEIDYILNLDNNQNSITKRIESKLAKNEKFYSPPKTLIISTKGKKDLDALRFYIKSKNIHESDNDYTYKLKYFAVENGTFYIDLDDEGRNKSVPGENSKPATIKDFKTAISNEGKELLLVYERYKG